MQIVIELDSFWVGFAAGVLGFFLLGLVLAARLNRKAAKKYEAELAEAEASPRSVKIKRQP